jgi:copper resistance protein C
VPSLASAHTQLTSSNPQEGQVITEDFKEITLTFGGNIEKLSTMVLLKDGKDIPLDPIQIQETNIAGPLKAPLGNGTYSIQWKIAGHDGHPVTGEIQFEVKKENMNQDANSPASNQVQGTNGEEQQNQTLTDQNQGTSGDEMEITTIKTDQKDQEKIDEKNTGKSSNNVIIAIFIGMLVILVIGFLLLLRKK